MEKLAKSREIAQNKLILLYILSKAQTPVSEARLSEYVSRQRLMEYLAFRQHFSELAAAGYIAQESEAGADPGVDISADIGAGPGAKRGGAYAITVAGLGMLAELGGLLPTPWARRIDRTATPMLGAAKNERAVVAIDAVDSFGGNVAELAIQDGGRAVIRISLLAGSRQDARAICKRWKDDTAALYSRIVETLTGNSDDDSAHGPFSEHGPGLDSHC